MGATIGGSDARPKLVRMADFIFTPLICCLSMIRDFYLNTRIVITDSDLDGLPKKIRELEQARDNAEVAVMLTSDFVTERGMKEHRLACRELSRINRKLMKLRKKETLA